VRFLSRSATVCEHDSMLKAGIQFDGLVAALAQTAHDGSQSLRKPVDMSAYQSLR